MPRFRPIGLLLLVCLSPQLLAQAPRLEGKQATKPPDIDGTISDAEWADAVRFEGLRDPTNGDPAPEGGTFWLSYDAKFIYFAARLNDSRPETIRAVEYRTNSEMPGDDYVSLEIDVSGSLQDFSSFAINPRGATSIQLAGGRAAKREWAGEFTARARITSTGWEAEARIPWQVMRLPPPGKRDVRFNIVRRIPRLGRGYSYGYTNNGRVADMPYWTGVVLPKGQVDRTIKLLPYAYAGYDETEGVVFNSGLDLKAQVANEIQFVGSINPDFRNIENSVLSLEFSRFARIADETRPFFQEGADYTSSGIFVSQTIGSFDAGANVYGKLNDKTQFGAIDTITLGRQNAFATTITHSPTANDSMRLSLTSLEEQGRSNGAYLARYSRSFGPTQVTARALGSTDTITGFGNTFTLDAEYGQGEWGGWSSLAYVEKDFNPGLGFEPETDYKGGEVGISRVRRWNKGPLISHGWFVDAYNYSRVNGNAYRHGFQADTFLTFRNHLQVSGNVDFPTFEGSNDHIYSVNLNYPDNDPYRSVGGALSTGEIGGENYRLASLYFNARPVQGLQLGLSYQRYELGETQEQTIFSVSYDLRSNRSLSGRLVARDSGTNYYLAYRQSGGLGAEYYVILGDPNADSFQTSLILKAVYPFSLDLGRKKSGPPERHVLK